MERHQDYRSRGIPWRRVLSHRVSGSLGSLHIARPRPSSLTLVRLAVLVRSLEPYQVREICDNPALYSQYAAGPSHSSFLSAFGFMDIGCCGFEFDHSCGECDCW